MRIVGALFVSCVQRLGKKSRNLRVTTMAQKRIEELIKVTCQIKVTKQ